MKSVKKLPEPLEYRKEMPKLPNGKSSIYQLSKRECRQWYGMCCKALYRQGEMEMKREYSRAVKDEPDGLDGVHVQLSSLLSYYFWWY